jgi:hypothetical protein
MSDARFLGFSGFISTIFGAACLPGLGAFCLILLGGIMIAAAVECGARNE